MTGERRKGKRFGRGVWLGAVFGFAAVFFLWSGMAAGTAYGAVGIETKREDCRITFTLDVEDLRAEDLENLDRVTPEYAKYYGELSEALREGSMEVQLYRIAEVDAGGRFRLLSEYAGNELLQGVEQADSETSAQEWSQWAAGAAEAVKEKLPDGKAVIAGGDPGTGTEAAGRESIPAGEGSPWGVSEPLSTGLYLARAESVETEGYTYRFIPCLIALPGRNSDDGEDGWSYGEEGGSPVVVGLKPEREDRYGDLIIRKTLHSYNETLGGAAFVFEIRAVKEDRLVYSDVEALSFEEPGTQELTVEGIPAGAKVTVTEIYSGASYSAVTDGVQETVIAAGEAVSVNFENTYDGGLNGGNTGVVNHFTYGKDENGADELRWEKQ